MSIITPSYNQAEFLERHLASVAAQGPLVAEHIIMDGASTDGTVELLKAAGLKIADLKAADLKAGGLEGTALKAAGPQMIWSSEPDRGQTSALRKALLRATGSVIGWLNVDEFYEADAVARAVRGFVENPGAVVVYGDFRRIDAAGELIRVNRQWAYDRNIGRVVTPIIQNCAGFFSRQRLLDVGAFTDESLQFVMDWDLYIRLMKDGGRAVYLPQVLGNFTMHKASKTSREQEGFDREIRELQQRQFPRLGPSQIKLVHHFHHIRMSLHMARTGILMDKMRFKLFDQIKYAEEYGSPGVTWFHRFR